MTTLPWGGGWKTLLSNQEMVDSQGQTQSLLGGNISIVQEQVARSDIKEQVRFPKDGIATHQTKTT